MKLEQAPKSKRKPKTKVDQLAEENLKLRDAAIEEALSGPEATKKQEKLVSLKGLEGKLEKSKSSRRLNSGLVTDRELEALDMSPEDEAAYRGVREQILSSLRKEDKKRAEQIYQSGITEFEKPRIEGEKQIDEILSSTTQDADEKRVEEVIETRNKELQETIQKEKDTDFLEDINELWEKELVPLYESYCKAAGKITMAEYLDKVAGVTDYSLEVPYGRRYYDELISGYLLMVSKSLFAKLKGRKFEFSFRHGSFGVDKYFLSNKELKEGLIKFWKNEYEWTPEEMKDELNQIINKAQKNTVKYLEEFK